MRLTAAMPHEINSALSSHENNSHNRYLRMLLNTEVKTLQMWWNLQTDRYINLIFHSIIRQISNIRWVKKGKQETINFRKVKEQKWQNINVVQVSTDKSWTPTETIKMISLETVSTKKHENFIYHFFSAINGHTVP